jgi:hypothetical protein
MADCKLIEKCIFFNDKMANMPGTSASFKRKFCQDNFSICARYQVFDAVGRDKVPRDLFPNQNDKVQKIIESV